MKDALTTRLYRRLGLDFRWVFILVQGPASMLVAAGTVLLVASYYDTSSADLLLLGAGGAVFTSWASASRSTARATDADAPGLAGHRGAHAGADRQGVGHRRELRDALLPPRHAARRRDHGVSPRSS